jgi:hypothetical protein
MIEKAEFGRTIEIIDIKTFTRDLAAAMDGKVLPSEDEYNTKRYAKFELDSCVIGVTAGWQTNKVLVTISPTGINPNDASPHGDKYKLPRINVSVERPIVTIVAHIKRRLIEPAKAPIAELRQYVKNMNRAANDLQAAAAKLRTAHPALQVKVGENETYSATVYSNDPGPYLNARLYADGTVSIDRLGSLSPEQFERLMAALYSEGAQQ